MNGKLITIEGISGSGKTTMSKEIANKLSLLAVPNLMLGGFEVRTYSSPITKFCRDLVDKQRFVGLPWLSEFFLLVSELMLDIESLVMPSLHEGKVVIFDGYWDSLVVFQSARARLENKKTEHMFLLSTVYNSLFDLYDIPNPDLTILMTCSVGEAAERLRQRDTIIVSEDDVALQTCIEQEYIELYRTKNPFVVKSTDRESIELSIQQIISDITQK